ncbi:MAG: hypothetical protein IJQ81_14685 [Oscillibacter sp.]|nr:hypothetical protein [Oscillibacter sp.]
MSIPQFHYSRDWTNPADFPTHQNNEAQNRADLEEAKTEWENYWNNVVLPALTGGDSGGGSGTVDTSGFLPLSGGTMSGALRLARSPQFETEAATKAYVDNAAQSVMTDGTNTTAIIQNTEAIELLAERVQGDLAELGRVVVKADEITAQLTNNLGYETLVQLLIDQLKLEVSRPTAQGDTVTANIILKVFDHAASYGQIILNGNVDVSGQLSADALYANYGEIADLHVDYLDTSRRIVRYLRGDQSDNNYLRAHDQILEFVTGSPSGATEQVRNPNGALLYWPMDVSGLSLGADGYPRYNGERVFTTTQATEYPVMAYRYTETVKRAIRFEEMNGIYSPVDTFGAGNASGLNRAYIVKTANGWDFVYTTSANKVLGIHMHNEGYVDIDGLRKTTGLDFSRFHEGYFTETVQGASQPKEYRVAFDGNGVPTGISDESGNTLNITW